VAGDHGDETLNMGVHASPLEIGALPTLMVTLRDTSDSQRRQVLERMFFHDALNAAGGLRGLMEVWPDLDPAEAQALAPAAARLAQQLVEEIEAHRDLVAAENGTLAVRPATVAPRALLDDLRTLYASHDVSAGKVIAVTVPDGLPAVTTDLVLMRRVLGNLLKNALEASAPAEAVTLGAAHDGGATTFTVHNPAVMPDAARLQVFQRAFTTKGRGRGLGTFGSRLIAERYLGARLTFDSAPGAGTTFRLVLPAASA
jgi:signal transduction histidine kinase